MSGERFDHELDTGSTYTWRKRLEGIGLKPFPRWKFRTIDVLIREISVQIGSASSFAKLK